ncbi:MAG: FAD-binding protein [Acidimicrobiaceae bacterium]|nr:FAD-binding protein [Acidimicrobiaceae bacterium]
MATTDEETTMSGRLTNWAGNVTFAAPYLHRPTTLSQLQELVAGSDRLRVLGSGHSFNHIADSSGDLVSVADLPATIELDAARRRVTVAAGVRYAELARELQAQGYALHNLGSLPHISVAGACATATHGSGVSNRNLAAEVVALELVDADGEATMLSRERDGENFDGAVVGLGALGVVTSMTLDVVPSFEVSQHVYERLPIAELLEHFADIVGSAYSVSLFTTWRAPEIDQVWLKHRVGDDRPPPVERLLFGATPADGPRHPIAGMPADTATEQLGVPGPWNERLPHFRAEFTPSAGEELQSEYLVPRDLAIEAIEAIGRIRELVAPLVLISEIRTVAPDELWISPSYHRDTVAFHFTWVKDTERVMPVLAAIERELAPLLARPHWGKLFGTDPAVVRGLYERTDDFSSLLRRHDPKGKFRNDFIDRYFPFEDA